MGRFVQTRDNFDHGQVTVGLTAVQLDSTGFDTYKFVRVRASK